MEMFISFFTGKVMLFYGISLIMKEKSNASALRPRAALPSAEGRLLLRHLGERLKGDGFLCWDAVCFFAVAEEVTKN